MFAVAPESNVTALHGANTLRNCTATLLDILNVDPFTATFGRVTSRKNEILALTLDGATNRRLM